MARKRTITASLLNVRTHPIHSPEKYIDLLKYIHSLRKAVPLRGDQRLILSSLNTSSEELVTGTFARFTQINMGMPWFDLEEGDKADDLKMRQIVIPPGMNPNFNSFEFAFFPKDHLLAFESSSTTGSLSPAQLVRAFSMLVEEEGVARRFGTVTVDLVQDKSGLQQIFSMTRIRKLTIRYGSPNGDGFDFDEKIEQRMQQEKVKRRTEILEAQPGQSIAPDEETQKLMEFSLREGYVEAEGKVGEASVTRRTLDMPLNEPVKYDPDVMSQRQAFMYAAREVVRRALTTLL